jgi:hypothetical protein
MPIEALIGNLDHLDGAIDTCLRERHIWPALALLYAGIDVVGSLEANPDRGSRASFTSWADRYMQPTVELGCTALELYGARCGLLHACTSESDLSKEGRVRPILYAWGQARAETLRELAARNLKEQVAVVHVDDLRTLFRRAVLAWWAEVAQDPSRQTRVASSAGMWLTNIDRKVAEQAAATGKAAV